MRTILVILFVLVITLAVYMTYKNNVNENYINCLPNTYKGSALQSYENMFKGGCFSEIDDNYTSNFTDTSVPINQDSHLPDSANYCFNYVRAPALFSHGIDTKPWCYFPSN